MHLRDFQRGDNQRELFPLHQRDDRPLAGVEIETGEILEVSARHKGDGVGVLHRLGELGTTSGVVHSSILWEAGCP